MSLKEEIKNIKSNDHEQKKFGLTVGSVFFALGILLLFLGRNSSSVFLTIGVILFFAGLFIPARLRLAYRFWMGAGAAMGWFMARVVLTILFYIVLIPLGIFARFLGKDFLNTRSNSRSSSYWQKRNELPQKSSYEKQF